MRKAGAHSLVHLSPTGYRTPKTLTSLDLWAPQRFQNQNGSITDDSSRCDQNEEIPGMIFVLPSTPTSLQASTWKLLTLSLVCLGQQIDCDCIGTLIRRLAPE